jgi:hypothetical protein
MRERPPADRLSVMDRYRKIRVGCDDITGDPVEALQDVARLGRQAEIATAP